MIKLIVNADDFGLSRGVNYGILDSYLFGIVNSTSLMMNMSGTEHAIQLAKNYPELRVGIHLTLTSGKPLLKDVPTLVNEDGHFKSQNQLLSSKDISLEELKREWTAQIEQFLSSGLKPTHLDSHHHVHTWKELEPVVKSLANKYRLPVRRNGWLSIDGVETYSDLSLFDFYGEGVNAEYFTHLAGRFEDNITVEIMCHPAYLDQVLLKSSSYFEKRLDEFAILTSISLPSHIVLL